jgi:hypothetical protein
MTHDYDLGTHVEYRQRRRESPGLLGMKIYTIAKRYIRCSFRAYSKVVGSLTDVFHPLCDDAGLRFNLRS